MTKTPTCIWYWGPTYAEDTASLESSRAIYKTQATHPWTGYDGQPGVTFVRFGSAHVPYVGEVLATARGERGAFQVVAVASRSHPATLLGVDDCAAVLALFETKEIFK
jgi:hypothetical protein